MDFNVVIFERYSFNSDKLKAPKAKNSRLKVALKSKNMTKVIWRRAAAGKNGVQGVNWGQEPLAQWSRGGCFEPRGARFRTPEGGEFDAAKALKEAQKG